MPHPLRSFNIPNGAQFGARRLSGKGHAGTDYHPKSNQDGDPIYGTLDGGRISAKGYGPSPVNGFGHWVKVAYPGGIETTNAHMREPSPWAVGAAVGPSTVIGYVGHTGNAVIADPPGSHVHHELRVNGVLKDPFAYYGGNATASINSKPIAAVSDPIKEDEDMYLVIDKGTPQKPSTGTYVVNAEGCTGISAGVESSLMRLFKVDRSEILLLMKTEIEELDGFLRANARLNR